MKMINFLIKRFVKNHEDAKNLEVRQNYGHMASGVGIVVNLLISLSKMVIGYISGSIAIISDGVNNFADAGSSMATFASFKISGKAPDMEHPYGHGRAEYLFSSGVAVVVMVVGIQFLLQAVHKIMNPEDIIFSPILVIVLVLSILGKVWLYSFNKKIANLIDSPILKATAADCLSDVLITTVVLVGLVGTRFVDFPIDGYLGVLVSFFIAKAGFEIFSESTSQLVGQEPSQEMVLSIAQKIKSYEGVCGLHDLMVHDYGPGNIFATVHVEVDSSVDIMVSHALIDQIEKEVIRDLGISLTIHMDPLATDAESMAMFMKVSSKVKAFDIRYSIHDFRVVPSSGETFLVFDLLIPYEDDRSKEEIEEAVQAKIKEIDPTYVGNVTIDRSYTGNIIIH